MNGRQAVPVVLVERLAALDEPRRTLLAQRLASLHGDARPDTTTSHDALVAHVVARCGHTPSAESLREHLAARLPAHMLPARFVAVETLPRTPAGKIDRHALVAPAAPATRVDGTAGETAPGGEAERILSEIWMDVLGLSEVGVEEDFFELGGDSLLSIRILSRATQRGLRISPETFFAKPTIAAQARAAMQLDDAAGERGPVSGPLPLTPIQHWFFERIPDHPEHWNQSYLFELRAPLSLSTLERAVQALLLQHDALRLQFDADARTALVAAPDSRLPASQVDLRGCADDRLAGEIDRIATTVNASLDLGRGPLLRFVLLKTRETIADRLLVLAHHLLVDGLSWRILLEDLETACASDETGRPLRLPVRTTSCRRWSERLVEHAQSEAVRAELPYWRDVCAQPAALPIDLPSGAGHNLAGNARIHRTVLDPVMTGAVMRELPAAHRVGVDRLLLAALAFALRRWRGAGPLRLDVEGHGRDPLFADLDVSRTVGWFTTVYPVCLELPAEDGPLAALAEVSARIATIPGGGVGFGLLRELCTDTPTRSALRPAPAQLLFNYLGQVRNMGGGARMALLHDACGTPRAASGRRAYLLEINAYLDDDTLRVDWSYGVAVHHAGTIAALAGDFAGALASLAEAARAGETAVARPEDFPLAQLDQDDLDGIAATLGDLHDDDATA